MTQIGPLKVLQNGVELDATFFTEDVEGQPTIVLESRGGTKGTPSARNVDYARGLALILQRLGPLGHAVLRIAVESRDTSALPLDARTLDVEHYPYPILLSGIESYEALRLAVGAAQQPIRSGGAGPKGNATKRIRIYVGGGAPADPAGLAAILAAGTAATEPLPPGNATKYERANESPSTKPSDPFDRDPDAVDRGLAAHAVVQNALHDFLAEHAIASWSPCTGDPPYDLGWLRGGVRFVAEVKSLPLVSEAQQLRLGLGQVLDYRHALAQCHGEVRAVLAVEREPSASRWIELCAAVGVTLVWPAAFHRVLDPALVA